MTLKPILFPAVLLATASMTFGQDIGVDAGAAAAGATANTQAAANVAQPNVGDVRTQAQTSVDTPVGQIQANGAARTNDASANLNGAVNTDAGQIGANVRGNTQQGSLNATAGSNLQTGTVNAGTQTDAGLNVNSNQIGLGADTGFGATLQADSAGLRVSNAMPGTAATAFGLQAGDRIIGLNGRTYANADAFNQALMNGNLNQQAELIYERNGQLHTRRAHLGSLMNRQATAGINHSVNRPIYGTQQATFSGNASAQPRMIQPSGYIQSGPTGQVYSQPGFAPSVQTQRFHVSPSFHHPVVQYGHVQNHCRPRFVYDYDDGEWERIDAGDWDDDDWEDYYEDRRDRMRDRWDD